MSVHTDTLSWLRANQFLFLLLNAACLYEKQQILILYSGMTLLRLEPMIYQTLGEHANNSTIAAVPLPLNYPS
jgi:hypothetical protein